MQRKCYIIVVTQALVVCLICTPEARGPRVYISGRPLVPVLQLLHIKYMHTEYTFTCMHTYVHTYIHTYMHTHAVVEEDGKTQWGYVIY